MNDTNDARPERPVERRVGPDYRQHAEFLTERVAELQRQVLVKHTAAVLAEMHDQRKARTPGPDMTPERFNEIAHFLAKNYPREIYPRWYSALDQAAAISARPNDQDKTRP